MKEKKNKNIKKSFRLDKEQFSSIRRYARENDLNYSQALRNICAFYFSVLSNEKKRGRT